MQIDIDQVNAELSAIAEAVRAPTLPREVAVHPFEAAKLGRAPFKCVACDIDETRCSYCTTPIKYAYRIVGDDGARFTVGSECVKQTGGAVAGFETFNRQMEARVRELQKKARNERKIAKAADAAAAWKLAHADEYAYMQKRAQSGSNYYANQLANVDKYGSVFDSTLVGIRRDIVADAARNLQQVPKGTDPAARAFAAMVQTQTPAPVIKLDPVEAAFAKAKAAGIVYPKLRLGAFVFSPASETSANAGAIYIKTRTPSGDLPGQYMGKVLGGRFLKVRECDAKAEAEILAIAADPKAAAIAYGKQFGKCSVCNRDLTDPESVAAGIGPICAGRYGF
jgi:hypothetical protein